jgi:mannose-6-phosphate isomerase-like protein (cupin superfamily)
VKLDETFAILKPDLSIDTIAVTPSVYAELDARFDHFKSHVLVASYEFESDWGVWEIHPAGDEIVILLSGAATLRMKIDSTEKVVELRESGSFAVVPRNTWHTAKIREATRMMFVTPGEGTENRADP